MRKTKVTKSAEIQERILALNFYMEKIYRTVIIRMKKHHTFQAKEVVDMVIQESNFVSDMINIRDECLVLI